MFLMFLAQSIFRSTLNLRTAKKKIICFFCFFFLNWLNHKVEIEAASQNLSKELCR